MIETQKGKGISFRSLEDSLEGKHYLLKCTDGIFDGKFLFINTTPDGEVFGSGNPEVNEDITMYIEAAELSERHADIKFQCPLQIQSQNSLEYETEFARKGQYVLKDCNS